MQKSSSLKACISSASQRNSWYSIETEGSLQHLQVPTNCPYPEPDQSSPCSHPTSWKSILMLSSHLCLCLSSGLFPSGFPTENLYTPDLSHVHTNVVKSIKTMFQMCPSNLNFKHVSFTLSAIWKSYQTKMFSPYPRLLWNPYLLLVGKYIGPLLRVCFKARLSFCFYKP